MMRQTASERTIPGITSALHLATTLTRATSKIRSEITDAKRQAIAVLIVGEPNFRRASLLVAIEFDGYLTLAANTPLEALELIDRSKEPISYVLVDGPKSTDEKKALERFAETLKLVSPTTVITSLSKFTTA